MSKTVLVFGDSNTWGWNPESTFSDVRRYPAAVRWPSVMQQALGNEYQVIAEGLNGRTTVWDDPIEEYRSGKQHLIPLLDSHAPLALTIIFVGTNDLKSRFGLTAQDISFGAGLLVQKALLRPSAFRNQTPRVLLVAPPPVGPLAGSIFEHMFQGAESISLAFGSMFSQVAAAHGVAFFDAGQHIKSSAKDGIHLEAAAHNILGLQLAEKVKRMFG